jgi:hypothetical protein
MGGKYGHALVTTRAAFVPPDIDSATLPVRYEQAREALAACENIDECKDWADKMAALASYAKQADDDTLQRLAMRIQARAIRRAGELLRTFKQRGGDRKSDQSRDDPTLITQRKAAGSAGMSKDQEVQAIRVANVPADEFDAAVDSDEPPTITALAERGTDKRPVPKAAPGAVEATQLIGFLRSLSAFCESHTPASVVVGLFDHEPKQIHKFLRVVGPWIEQFVSAMEERDGSNGEVHAIQRDETTAGDTQRVRRVPSKRHRVAVEVDHD